MVKNTSASAGYTRDMDLITGLGRSPGGRLGNPFQYSCLGNPMDRGAWWAAVHRVTKSWTQVKRLSSHAKAVNTINQSDGLDTWWRGFPLRALLETISAASLLRLAQTSGLSIKLWFLFTSIPALEDRYVYVSMCRGDLSCLKSSPVWGFSPSILICS